MGTLRTLAILVFSALVLYAGLFAVIYRDELIGSSIPGILLIITALGTLGAFLRARYRAAKSTQSTVEYRT